MQKSWFHTLSLLSCCAGLITLSSTSYSANTAPAPARKADEAQLVNLDARVHGIDNPITLNLSKGVYEVKPVGKAAGGQFEAWSVWDRTNCTRANGCPRLVPTRFTGMHNNYYIASANLAKASVDGKPLPTVNEVPQNRDSSYFLQKGSNRAYEVAEAFSYPDEASALVTAKSSLFTLDKDGPVQFLLLDKSRMNDNRGGMSLQVRKVGN